MTIVVVEQLIGITGGGGDRGGKPMIIERRTPSGKREVCAHIIIVSAVRVITAERSDESGPSVYNNIFN